MLEQTSLNLPLYLQNGPAYCEAFLNVLRSVTKEEAVQYVLALIDDMLSGVAPGSVDLLRLSWKRRVTQYCLPCSCKARSQEWLCMQSSLVGRDYSTKKVICT